MTDIFVAAAKRTPVGRLNGTLSDLSATELSAQAIAAMLAGADVDPGALDEVILGQVLTGGAGQNPARQAALAAGIPVSVPAMTVNKVCGAGQKSIHLAAQAIFCGDAGLVVAGGQDSMTNAPVAQYGARQAEPGAGLVVRDMMIVDGLWDAFHDVHMGTTVEGLARRYQITREAQDRFALDSQQKAGQAMAAGRFADELVPVRTGAGGSVAVDEHPRPEITLEKLASMQPAFDPQGTITAGNSSGLNDGAAVVLVGSERRLRELGLTPMVRIAAYASAALEPMDMGLGPVFASRKALQKTGWTAADPDLLEINEAFAAQALAVNLEMGWDPARINVNGGAIALGHPLAGTGCRIVVTLIHEMRRRGAKRGLAAQCIGGGQGVAICLEAC